MKKHLLILLTLALTFALVAGCSEMTDKVSGPQHEMLTETEDVVTPPESDVGGKGNDATTSLGMCISVHVPFYSQNDPNFKNVKLGYSNYWTIGNSGCYLTCVSMLYAKWGYYNMNPRTLNNWSYRGKAHYAFYDNTPYINPYRAIQYPGVCRSVRSISKNKNAVIAELQRGRPVLAKVNWYGGSHFVLISGWDGTRFWAKDPVKDWRHQDQPVTAGLSEVYYLKVLGY